VKKFPLTGSQRLKKRHEFTDLQAHGKKIFSKHFLILIAPSELPKSRLGITVTTKIDKRSVGRNLIKRRVREFFRTQQHRLTGIFDLVVIARQEANLCTFEEIRRELSGALKYHKFFDGTRPRQAEAPSDPSDATKSRSRDDNE
jgi:ribonuclease P protein component